MEDQTDRYSVRRKTFLSAVLAAFAIGVFIGSGFMAMISPSQTDRALSTARDEDFRFIRTALSAKEGEEHRPNRELAPFRYKVKALIDERIRRHEAQAASVYFRDLNNGSWFGIGEKEKFSPKSLLKLPLMMAYFKWAESNPFVLRKRLPTPLQQRPIEVGLSGGKTRTGTRQAVYGK